MVAIKQSWSVVVRFVFLWLWPTSLASSTEITPQLPVSATGDFKLRVRLLPGWSNRVCRWNFRYCRPIKTALEQKNYPYPPSFFAGTNLQTKPTRRLVIKKKKKGDRVHESFNNVHYFPLEQQRIDRIKVFLRRGNGESILFRGGSVVLTLRFRNRQHTLALQKRQKWRLPSRIFIFIYRAMPARTFNVTTDSADSRWFCPTCTSWAATNGKWHWWVCCIRTLGSTCPDSSTKNGWLFDTKECFTLAFLVEKDRPHITMLTGTPTIFGLHCTWRRVVLKGIRQALRDKFSEGLADK